MKTDVERLEETETVKMKYFENMSAADDWEWIHKLSQWEFWGIMSCSTDEWIDERILLWWVVN